MYVVISRAIPLWALTEIIKHCLQMPSVLIDTLTTNLTYRLLVLQTAAHPIALNPLFDEVLSQHSVMK